MLLMNKAAHTGTPLMCMAIPKNSSGNGVLVLLLAPHLYECGYVQVQTHGKEE